jgi:hypothetical protein
MVASLDKLTNKLQRNSNGNEASTSEMKIDSRVN